MKPRMFYFGPWSRPGHHMWSDDAGDRECQRFLCNNPWGLGIDGDLPPKNTRKEGAALVHQKGGWTALSFWDYTVDTRPGSHSTYLAMGDFNFGEMVLMAAERFPYRWRRMRFEVFQA